MNDAILKNQNSIQDSLSGRFLLTTSECELLLALEEGHSLTQISESMNRDHSVLTRALKKLSEKIPVVEKKGGRWALTSLGQKINEASRSMIASQMILSQNPTILKIGTNREFGARILGPDLPQICEAFSNCHISIYCYENGIEEALLKGQIDVGFDCDRPYDPEIAFKTLVQEPLLVVCGKEFYKKNQKVIQSGNYLSLPHLLCERLNPNKLVSKGESVLNIFARFNDIATARAACLQNLGWAFLPHYALIPELKSKSLVQIDPTRFGQSKYGVWWIRNRTHVLPAVEKLSAWLATQKL